MSKQVNDVRYITSPKPCSCGPGPRAHQGYAYNYQELVQALGWEPVTICEAESAWRERYRSAVRASGMPYADDDLVWFAWADELRADRNDELRARGSDGLNKLYEIIGDMIAEHLGLAVGEESPATTVFIRKGKLCALAERIFVEITAEYLPEPDVYGLEDEEGEPE